MSTYKCDILLFQFIQRHVVPFIGQECKTVRLYRILLEDGGPGRDPDESRAADHGVS